MRLGVLKSKRRSVRQGIRELRQKVANSVLGYSPKPITVDLGTCSFTTIFFLRSQDSGFGWVRRERLYECKIMAVIGKRIAPEVIEEVAQRLRDEGWGAEMGLLRCKEGFIFALCPTRAVRVWRVWGDKIYEVSINLAGSDELRALATAITRIEELLKDPSYFNVDLTDPALEPAIIEHYLRGYAQ
jgi:hypothetical protein